MDIRCRYCNWLNKEIQENFVCKNCKKENSKEIVVVKKNKEDFQLNTKGR